MVNSEVVEPAEFIYRVIPSVPMTNLALVQKLNRRVHDEALQRANLGQTEEFSFDIGGLLQVEVMPLNPSFPSSQKDPRSLKVKVRPQQATGEKPVRAQEMFSLDLTFPDPAYEGRIDRLIGIDSIVAESKSVALSLMSENAIQVWALRHHPTRLGVIKKAMEEAYPVMIFSGDPGVGKTELALSMGDWLAREIGEPVNLLKLDLRVRGGGHVGELTSNIGGAWQAVVHRYVETMTPIIFLIDEAEGLVQSRVIEQQHHEDRAGVDAIIQHIDQSRGMRIVTIFATNLIDFIDPAVQRRIGYKFRLPRPDLRSRRQLFCHLLDGLVPEEGLDDLASLTEGYTPADIRQIFDRSLKRAFMTNAPITLNLLRRVVADVPPTPPMEVAPKNSSRKRTREKKPI